MSPTTSGLLVYLVVFGAVLMSCIERINNPKDPLPVPYRQVVANAAIWPIHLFLIVLRKIVSIVNHLTK